MGGRKPSVKNIWWWRRPIDFYDIEPVAGLTMTAAGRELLFYYEKLCDVAAADRGYLLDNSGASVAAAGPDRVAWLLRVGEEKARQILDDLTGYGLIREGNESDLYFPGVAALCIPYLFDKIGKPYSMTAGARRVRRFRARQKYQK